jgi:hypothetical protein
VSRVRQFIERYGRVFGEGFVAEANASVAAELSGRPLLGVPATPPAPSAAPPEKTSAEPDSAVIDPPASPVEPLRHEDDLIILEEDDPAPAAPLPPIRPGVLPRGEDIVFID